MFSKFVFNFSSVLNSNNLVFKVIAKRMKVIDPKYMNFLNERFK